MSKSLSHSISLKINPGPFVLYLIIYPWITGGSSLYKEKERKQIEEKRLIWKMVRANVNLWDNEVFSVRDLW